VEDLEKLQEFEKNRGKFRVPLDIRPCIVYLLNEFSSKDGLKPLIIACELHRVGKTEKQIEAQLRRLNVKESDIGGNIRSAFRGKYKYSCPRLERECICLEENRFDCFWFQRFSKRSQVKWRERDFWRFGWPHKLKSAEIVMYLGIIETEQKRGYTAGTIIYASRDQLAEVTGLSEKWTIECCKRLRDKGLIKFTPGRQHKHYGQASRIKRIIPMPRIKR